MASATHPGIQPTACVWPARKNRTGQWATREVLAKYDTDEITPAMQAKSSPSARRAAGPKGRTMPPSPSWKSVYAVIERGPKKHWLRVGMAFA